MVEAFFSQNSFVWSRRLAKMLYIVRAFSRDVLYGRGV